MRCVVHPASTLASGCASWTSSAAPARPGPGRRPRRPAGCRPRAGTLTGAHQARTRDRPSPKMRTGRRWPFRSGLSIRLVWYGCRPDSAGVYASVPAFDTANNPAPSVVLVEMLSITGMGELVTSRCARLKPSAKSVPLCRKSRCPWARTCRSRRPAAAPCALRLATAARRCFLCRSRSRPAGSGWCRATPCPQAAPVEIAG